MSAHFLCTCAGARPGRLCDARHSDCIARRGLGPALKPRPADIPPPETGTGLLGDFAAMLTALADDPCAGCPDHPCTAEHRAGCSLVR